MNQTTEYLQSLSSSSEIETVTLVELLLADAVQVGASDIHIEPWESTLAVRIRLNGVLTELVHLPLEAADKVTARLKVMANLVSYQSDLPQEGHVTFDPKVGSFELRVSFFPTVRGEKIVIRIFDPSNRSFELAGLGFEEDTLETLKKLLNRPSGLLLMTGPTGSGKTVTIYSALTHIINRSGPAISISTVEDPVEFGLPMVSQGQINLVKEFTYPVALRSLLRQDPQVIMVGEIRDAETAQIAVQAGLTGHLVISTVHSGSAAGVFARLINMKIEPFLLASSIIGIMGVRLIRKNCPHCAQAYTPEPAFLNMVPEEFRAKAVFQRGAGCPECLHTGFSGRVVVSELLVVNEVLREAILQKLPTRTLEQVAIEQGMQTLWQMGLRRVLRGQTPLEEILRVLTVDQG